ncbi:MAG: cytochrome c [Flavobacteriales bacterium]|nr:cytochrome c [Flavobacteriales bacterium]
MKRIVTIAIILAGVVFTGFTLEQEPISDETPVFEVLDQLGQTMPDHFIANPDPDKVHKGYELVHFGRTDDPNGGMSKFISKFYVCTDCHNQVREDPDIANPSPEARLKHAIKNDLKFLQSTTFWGMVNRETFYNDDYEKKYGALVDKARTSLAESTQLCAKECSSGRYLEDWELECILHYYMTLQLKMGDLDLSAKEIKKFANASGLKDKERAKDKLKSRYTTASHAHFGDWPANTTEGYANTDDGDPKLGEAIYEHSCMTCHRMYGPSQLVLDKSELTFNKFVKHMTMNTKFNLYEITRKGTYAEPGHRQYMPMYPLERLSNQQVEHLRAYIESQAAS